MLKKLFIIWYVFIFLQPLTSQSYLNSYDQERLWSHVELTPNEIEKNPEKIINYLQEAVSNKREMIEIIFYWIADNISYDIDSWLYNSKVSVNPAYVLENKKTTCEGYAKLFKELCDLANIECVIIRGFAKGYGYNGKREYEPDHAWNAVKLNGEWKLLDVTWGCGYLEMINNNLKFKKELNLFYIFSNPSGFIIEHFPEDSKWQLIEMVISIDKFYSNEMDANIPYKNYFLR